MALDIGAALREGFGRTTERNALVLVVAFALVGLASGVVTQSLLVESARALAEVAAEQGQDPGFDPARVAAEMPLAVELPLSVAAALALATALLAEAVRIVAVRTFVSDATATVPREFLTRRIGWATGNGFLGGIVVGALVLVGVGLLVVPGIFFALSFFFVRQEIAVEDRDFVDAMAAAWRLSRGDRFEILGLAVGLLAVGLAASAPSLGVAVVDETASTLVGIAVSAVVGVFSVAVASRAYVQLREARRAEARVDDGEPDDEYAGALGPDDLPEP